jgi:hypothetical protein
MWCHLCSFAGATKLHAIFIELILGSLAQKRERGGREGEFMTAIVTWKKKSLLRHL